MVTYFGEIEQARNCIACERMLADLQTLGRDTEDLLKATAYGVSGKAGEVRARITTALERAKATCSELQAQTVATAKAAAMKTDTVIREHPYESVGVAFGVGLLIGVLVAPSHRQERE
jgi:ElaB/YqjD/DUF883 family membrane-anchored ribosome-binding protein